MPITLSPLTPGFAAEVGDVDLWAPLSDDGLQTVRRAFAEHSLMYSRRRLGFTEWSEQARVAFAPVGRPLVRTLPESGRRSPYLASHIGRIRGLPDDAAQALLDRLVAHATGRRFTCLHRRPVGDPTMWDNRCTMHRGTPFDDTRRPRDMQRATVSDRPDAFGGRSVPAAEGSHA